jgi:hypothetical protein
MSLVDLDKDETELRGAWLPSGRSLDADHVCRRIGWLCASRLVLLGTDSSGWDKLYRDPQDGRLWELTYPMSDLHGGGPPLLSLTDAAKAQTVYGIRRRIAHETFR